MIVMQHDGLKKLKKKVGDGVIKSTVEGVVKEATDEASAKNENKPVVSVVDVYKRQI